MCGTVSKNRKRMPKFNTKWDKGPIVGVCMLSTTHTERMGPTGKTDTHQTTNSEIGMCNRLQ